MNPKLLALKFYLDGLGVNRLVGTRDDCDLVQNSVFLAQLTKADLGYRYWWCTRFVMCDELTEDYVRLSDEISSGYIDKDGKVLIRAFRDKLESVRPLLTAPPDVELPQRDWLDLVAPYCYLRRVTRCSEEEAEKVLRPKIPNLDEWIEQVKRELSRHELVPVVAHNNLVHAISRSRWPTSRNGTGPIAGNCSDTSVAWS